MSCGRRPGAKNYSAFLEDLQVPTEWDTSAINIDADHARIKQQRMSCLGVMGLILSQYQSGT